MLKKLKKAGNVSVTEFMMGRYGYDPFSKFLIILSMLLLVATALMQGARLNMMAESKYMYLVAILVMGFGYYRMASKNIKRRKKENEAYLKFISRFSRKAKMQLEQEEKAKKYATFEAYQELGEDGVTVYRCYRCRNCGTELRFEEGQGLKKIQCPNCSNSLLDRI